MGVSGTDEPAVERGRDDAGRPGDGAEGLVSPTAPAIAEAVHDAVGVRCTELPITPARVLEKVGTLGGRETR